MPFRLPVICLLLASSSLAAQSPTPPESFHDAELTSVCFVDADNGWTVGDRGVIWHTIDGGRHWQRQDSPTSSRLESVCFSDAETGWAVGGSHHPYTHHGIGVVLRTVDGGASWQSVTGTNLPALKCVKFFGPRQGIAIGESSALYPGGVFSSVDGGRTWSTLVLQNATPTSDGETAQRTALRTSSHWATGDFANAQGGMVASSAGTVGNVSALDLVMSPRSVTAGRRPRALRVARAGQAWLCGERGLLLTSQDAGGTWSKPERLLPETTAQFDFSALATHGKHVWVAGEPGTLVFHSPDAGETWESLPTDGTVPIKSLYFLDENRGWAVGGLGTILHTRDGGRSWRMQRQGGTRTALLAIFSQPNRVPHELLVQQAGNEGYLTAVEILTRSDSRDDDLVADRTRESMSTLLAAHTSTAWQFPIPKLKEHATLEQMLSTWDGGDGGPAMSNLEEHLVRKIRMWRPDVVVTEDACPQGDNPLSHLTNQLVLAAVQRAADPSAYRAQIEISHLTEWKVKKVFAATAANKQGDIKLVCSQLAPRLGASLVDVADEARGQIEDTYSIAPAHRGLALLVDHLPQGQGRRDIFSGIALLPGGDARRVLSNPPVPDFTSLSKQIQKRQLLQGLLERSEQDPLRGQAWLAQVTEMTKGLPAASSARIMYHLAQRYQASGESELAAEVMTTLLEKHANHPLADASLLWLLHYYASAEAAHRLHSATHLVQPVVATEEEATGPGSSVQAVSSNQPVGNRIAHAKGVAAERIEPNQRLDRALALGKLLEKNHTALFADPSVRFTLVKARANAPSASLERDRIMQSLAASPASGDWAACAKAELFIAGKGSKVCPKRNFLCKTAGTKPKLDGRLDDEVWAGAKSVSLRENSSRGESLESIVAVAHDKEFLYIAISCQRAAGFAYGAEDRVRERDAKLQTHDRVELLLDIDRDYSTYYRLAIDHRGWTSETCLGDPSWNPAWYVATAGDDTHWTAEAAIPLGELTPNKPPKKTYWAVGLQRIVPGTSVQSWTPDADLDVRPEGFGLMQFE